MKEIWQIIDSNGVIESGTQQEMEIIWDYSTMDLPDLCEKNEHIKRSTLKAKVADNAITSWVGDLKLIQIHKTFK